jgi:hypothetical protein
MNAIYAADFEGEGCLSQVLTQNLHMQTIDAKQLAILGEPGAIRFGQPSDPNVNIPEGVTYGELDSIPGEDTHWNMNVPVHPVGIGPVILLEENGAARKNVSIEGDRVPYIELQEPGVSHLTTLEEVKFLTSSLSLSPHIILKAASMQCPLAINTTCQKSQNQTVMWTWSCHMTCNYPPLLRLLGCSTCWPSTQRC